MQRGLSKGFFHFVFSGPNRNSAHSTERKSSNCQKLQKSATCNMNIKIREAASYKKHIKMLRKWLLLCVCMKRVSVLLVFIFVFRGNECSKSMPNKRNYESCVSGPKKKERTEKMGGWYEDYIRISLQTPTNNSGKPSQRSGPAHL